MPLSRQRLHQIDKNYHNTGRRGRLEKYLALSSQCELCQCPREVLHHRDTNNSNDEIDNLQPLCRKCHYKMHTGRKGKELTKSEIREIRKLRKQWWGIAPLIKKFKVPRQRILQIVGTVNDL